MLEFKVICINDYNKPDVIPDDKWVVKQEEYTVINVMHHPLDSSKISFVLKEIELDSSCYPYTGFNCERFVLRKKDLGLLNYLLENGQDKEIIENEIEENVEIDLNNLLRNLNINKNSE